MALEQFKTQVLLLHSQQSTLDTLSAGFDDRYAVHVATSGTEALTTLGATPIHVIISAQDLPGMSGLEALREARKRSPDTIGILLAGNDPEDGLEALVGDKEVFQVVRGAVTPEDLQTLIDTATKRVRMLTISESANDLAANVDEPAGEHIVMQTSENGTTIISDGTGKFPAFRPRHVHISPHAGGREVDVLVLTKDEDFLETIRDSSHESHTVHHANTPAQAEAIVRDHKVGVLVTDAAMVGSKIELITERLRQDRPRLVAVVAGRRDDGELLMDLINRGQVYRFLLKPVSPGRARLAIEASVKHHLEAAESAFKAKPRDAASPKDERKAASPSKVTRLSPKVSPPPVAGAKEAPPTRPVPAVNSSSNRTEPRMGDAEPTAGEERLDSAFEDSGRFTRTMTGLATTVGKTFGGAPAQGEPIAAPADGSGTAGGPVAMLKSRPGAIGAAAAAVLVAVVLWLSMSGTPGADPERTVPMQTAPAASTPSVAETDVPLPADTTEPAVDAPPPAYQEFLDEARIAREHGEIVVPPGSNAIELYVAAREIAPDVAVIGQELSQAIVTAIGLAESALLDQRMTDAAQALRLVRLADPQNSRLPFLEAQLSQLQLRASLDQARLAIREQRFEDAAAALGNAEGVAGETAEIALLVTELADARSDQRVDEVLLLASQRVEQNALTSPANDSARYYYELALSNDPTNTVARQGLTIVASKLVLSAREAIDAGQLDAAENYLRDATELDPQGADLGAATQALNSAKADREAAALAEAERQAELQRQEALALAAPEAAGGGTRPGETGSNASASAEGASTQALLANAANTADNQTTDGVDETGGASTRPGGQAGGSGEPASAGQNSGNGSSQAGPTGFVPISSLKRVNYVAPEYPRSAQRRNITGWVDVSFTVNRSGNVVDVEVMDSRPGDIFSDAATEAVEQWRFEPSFENGVAAEKLVAVRLMFSLE